MRARSHFNPFSVQDPSEIPDWKAIFPNDNPIDLEIGFSTGRWLLGYAQKFPERNIVGLEIRNKFVDLVKERIAKKGLTNVYVLRANVNTALKHLFNAGQLSKVFLLFPDPWRKDRHLKRRVIVPSFLEELPQYLTTVGELHIATDRPEFGKEMIAQIEEHGKFVNMHGQGKQAAATVEGLVTDIEEFNLEQGKAITRCAFRVS